MEAITKKRHQRDWQQFLFVQKALVEQYFDWLKLHIDLKEKKLIGNGKLHIGGRTYEVLLSFSPFHRHRFDRIYITDSRISYHRDIHIYGDLSLCLYHPIIDQAMFRKIPLYQMVPWISEWIVFYEQWLKYGVWLGREIKH